MREAGNAKAVLRASNEGETQQYSGDEVAAQSGLAEIQSCDSAYHAKVRESLADRASGGDVEAQSDLVSIRVCGISHQAEVIESLADKTLGGCMVAHIELA